MKKAKSILGLTVCAALAASALPMNIIADAATGDEVLYGTMKIPYAEFYAAELEGASNVNVLDAVSSATDRKSLMTGAGQMFEGAWSEAVTDAGVNGAGNEIKAKIYGVVYPVVQGHQASRLKRDIHCSYPCGKSFAVIHKSVKALLSAAGVLFCASQRQKKGK